MNAIEGQGDWSDLKESQEREKQRELEMLVGPERAQQLNAEIKDTFDHLRLIATEHPESADEVIAVVRKINNELAQLTNPNKDSMAELRRFIGKIDTAK